MSSACGLAGRERGEVRCVVTGETRRVLALLSVRVLHLSGRGPLLRAPLLVRLFLRWLLSPSVGCELLG